MSVDQLKDLIGCGKGWAEERAAMALDFTELHALGELADDEYKELMQYLIRTDALDEEADDIAVKSALVNTINGLIKLL